MNGTNTGAVDPPPSGLEQPVGGGAQQTLMMSTSSGPSTFSAGQPLVPQLLQQDRTGVPEWQDKKEAWVQLAMSLMQ